MAESPDEELVKVEASRPTRRNTGHLSGFAFKYPKILESTDANTPADNSTLSGHQPPCSPA